MSQLVFTLESKNLEHVELLCNSIVVRYMYILKKQLHCKYFRHKPVIQNIYNKVSFYEESHHVLFKDFILSELKCNKDKSSGLNP